MTELDSASIPTLTELQRLARDSLANAVRLYSASAVSVPVTRICRCGHGAVVGVAGGVQRVMRGAGGTTGGGAGVGMSP